ncbi:MAG: hypothetical protein B7Z21_00520, partial [Verrucomicrobiales bacterium 32-60-5]
MHRRQRSSGSGETHRQQGQSAHCTRHCEPRVAAAFRQAARLPDQRLRRANCETRAKIATLPVRINIEEIKRPELSAKLVAENIARQLERRGNFRRAMKMAAQNTMNAGAKGIRIQVAGRLNN